MSKAISAFLRISTYWNTVGKIAVVKIKNAVMDFSVLVPDHEMWLAQFWKTRNSVLESMANYDCTASLDN